jgi:hypothetical protein
MMLLPHQNMQTIRQRIDWPYMFFSSVISCCLSLQHDSIVIFQCFWTYPYLLLCLIKTVLSIPTSQDMQLHIYIWFNHESTVKY